MSEIDAGFDAVLAGEVWTPPEPETVRLTQPGTGGIELTVAVSAPDPEPAPPELPPSPITNGLTPAGVQAAKALVHLPDLSMTDLARLAREIAMDIKEKGTILKEFKLSDAQYDFLENYNPFYKQTLAAACTEWNAPMSTPQRIKIISQAILEDSLLPLGARMQNKGEGLPGVVEAAKLFVKIAEVGEPKSAGGGGGERVVIHIDLGAGAPPAAGGEKTPITIDLSAQPSSLPQDGGG